MHEMFMHRCLQLAEQARGKTGINPMVGAVLVRDGAVVAEGYHKGYGLSHAELDLLQRFDQKISSKDTLYVNLEPCCHSNKQTPPCVQMLLERGVKNVVYGMIDPNPNVAGKGVALLRDAGVTVTGPVLRAECEWLNRGFVSFMKKGRPWITLKHARTQEGHIAHADGSAMSITTARQNEWSHTSLRAKHDAILVGVETVLTDDPLLNTRLIKNKKVDQFSPIRIILDPHCRVPVSSKLFQDASAVNIVCVVPEACVREEKKVAVLRGNGTLVFPVMLGADGRFAWRDLWQKFTAPNEYFPGLLSVLVEGGSRTWESFRASGMRDAEVTLLGQTH